MIPLLHSDALVSEWPILGVWLRGVDVSGSPQDGFAGLDDQCVARSRVWLLFAWGPH